VTEVDEVRAPNPDRQALYARIIDVARQRDAARAHRRPDRVVVATRRIDDLLDELLEARG
jgi:hypothetical protein